MRSFSPFLLKATGFTPSLAKTTGKISPSRARPALLVVVKTDFLNAHIGDAVKYVLRVARDLNNRPAVVNLSLGGHSDPHDGTDSLSRILDAESGPGRIVCCSAGNEGTDDIHARVTVTGGAQTLRLASPTGTVGMAILNGWYAGSIRLEIAVVSPGGFVTPFQRVLAVGDFEATTPSPTPRSGWTCLGPTR